MTDEQIGDNASISYATYQALVMAGPDALRYPNRFLGMLLDDVSEEQPEMRLLYYNCDEELLTPFAELFASQQSGDGDLEGAIDKASRILYEERVVVEEPARTATRSLAAAIALHFCKEVDSELGDTSLTEAIREALAECGGPAQLVQQSERFRESLIAHADRTMPEARVLLYNCDKDYLAPLLGVYAPNDDDLSGPLSNAAIRVAQILEKDRAINATSALKVVDLLAGGIANYLGVSYTNMSQPEVESSAPSASAQTPSAENGGVSSSWSNVETASGSSQGGTGWQASVGSQGRAGWQGSVGSQGGTGWQGSVGSQGGTGWQGSVGSQGIPSASNQSAPGTTPQQDPPPAPSTPSLPVFLKIHSSNPPKMGCEAILIHDTIAGSQPLADKIVISEVGVSRKTVSLRLKNIGSASMYISSVRAIGDYNGRGAIIESTKDLSKGLHEVIAPGASIGMAFQVGIADSWTKTESRTYEIKGYVQVPLVRFVHNRTAPNTRQIMNGMIGLIESKAQLTTLTAVLTNTSIATLHINKVVAYASTPDQTWSSPSTEVVREFTLEPGKTKTVHFFSKRKQYWSTASRYYEITGYAE